MAKVNFSQDVTEALNNLAAALVSGSEALKTKPIQEASTEELVTEMQGILDELKSRVTPRTLALHELPVGSKVQDSRTAYYGSPITWLIADHGFYGDTLTTLLSERILTFKAFDAAEPGNPDERRANYGNNNYKVSNLGQWLNSYEDDWFVPMHRYDQAPTENYVSSRPYADESGFLTNFSEDFQQHINDGVLGKIFLLSSSEVGLSDDGEKLSLFENEAFRKAKPTKECVQIDQEGDVDEPDWWWLRTPNAGYSHIARYVHTSGALGGNNAYYGSFGARPALNLSSEIRVKAEPNESGIYEIVWGS